MDIDTDDMYARIFPERPVLNWLTLPSSIWPFILVHLKNPKELANFCKACRVFRKVACTALYPRDFDADLIIQHPFLSTLNLSRCRHLNASGIAQLRPLKSLRHLVLTGCRVNDDGVREISRLTGVRTLNLSDCSQVGSGVSTLSLLTELRTLSLSRCTKLSDTCLGGIGHISSLTALDISFCWEITDSGVAALCPLRGTLKDLSLSWCPKITDAGLKLLSNVTAITNLDVSWCTQITDAGVRHLRALLNMRFLNLTACRQVTTAGHVDLSVLTQLKIIV